MKIVLVTGGFDPLHSGHIAYFEEARQLGDKLIVGINSDEWLRNKKSKEFMTWDERSTIISNLKMVDEIISFDDSDFSSRDAIIKVRQMYPTDEIIFANGGDRTEENIPEMDLAGSRLSFVFGVGGTNKQNSSSWILDDWKTQKTDRLWGYWRVLDDKHTSKVKELVINPGCSLSNQRHFKRDEFWYVLHGTCSIETEFNGKKETVKVSEHSTYHIGKTVWHRAYNKTKEPCHIIEIQYGEECIEEDIERK